MAATFQATTARARSSAIVTARASKIARPTDAFVGRAGDAQPLLVTGRLPFPCRDDGRARGLLDPEIVYQAIDDPTLQQRNRQEQHRLHQQAEQAQRDRSAIWTKKFGLEAPRKRNGKMSGSIVRNSFPAIDLRVAFRLHHFPRLARFPGQENSAFSGKCMRPFATRVCRQSRGLDPADSLPHHLDAPTRVPVAPLPSLARRVGTGDRRACRAFPSLARRVGTGDRRACRALPSLARRVGMATGDLVAHSPRWHVGLVAATGDLAQETLARPPFPGSLPKSVLTPLPAGARRSGSLDKKFGKIFISKSYKTLRRDFA